MPLEASRVATVVVVDLLTVDALAVVEDNLTRLTQLGLLAS
jgi:hypothetical protein